MLQVFQWICCLRSKLQKPFMKLPQFQIDHYEDCDSRCNRPNRWNLGFHFAYWINVGEKVLVDIFCFRPSSSSTSSWLGTLSDSFGKRILSSPPVFLHLLPALFHICHTTQVRSPDKLAHITNPSLTVTECDVFRFYLLFPLFPFPPLSKCYLKSSSGAAKQPPWRARRGALLSWLQTTEARGHVSSTL